MAKILENEQQKEALQIVEDGLHDIEALNKMLTVSEVMVSLGGRNKVTIPTSSRLVAVLNAQRKQLCKEVKQLAEKWAIGLSEEDEDIISGEKKSRKAGTEAAVEEPANLPGDEVNGTVVADELEKPVSDTLSDDVVADNGSASSNKEHEEIGNEGNIVEPSLAGEPMEAEDGGADVEEKQHSGFGWRRSFGV